MIDTVNPNPLASVIEKIAENIEAQKSLKREPKVKVSALAKDIELPKVVPGGAFEFYEECEAISFCIAGHYDQRKLFDDPLIEIFNAIQKRAEVVINTAAELNLVKICETTDQINLDADIPVVLRPVYFTPLYSTYDEKTNITRMKLWPASNKRDGNDIEVDPEAFQANAIYTIKYYIADELIDSVNCYFNDDNGYILYSYLIEQEFEPEQKKYEELLKRPRNNNDPLQVEAVKTAKAKRDNAAALIEDSIAHFIINQLKLPRSERKTIPDTIHNLNRHVVKERIKNGEIDLDELFS